MRLPTQPALMAVALASGMAAAWTVGRHVGAGDAVAPSPAPVSGTGAARLDPQAQMAALARDRDTALASVAMLRDRLAEAERRQADDAADLALYRRLGERGTSPGLGIDTVAWRRHGGQTVLDITLVQARGRHRVSGTLGVSVSDDPAPGLDRELVPDTGDGAIPFDLRFFQTVSVPMDASITTVPPSGGIVISVRPHGERHPAFVDIRARNAIIVVAPDE